MSSPSNQDSGGRDSPRVKFGVTFDFEMPYHYDYDRENSEPPNEEAYALRRLGERLRSRRFHVTTYDLYHNYETYFSSRRSNRRSGDYAHWHFAELPYSIGPLDEGELDGMFSVRFKTPLMGESDIEDEYADLFDLLNLTYDQAEDWIYLHTWYDMKVHVSLTNEAFGLREAKRMTTLVLLLEEMVLWPLTFNRRKRFSPLEHHSNLTLGRYAHLNNRYSLERDPEARQDLPWDLRGIFGDALVNIWRCEDMQTLAANLQGAEDALTYPAAYLKLYLYPRGTGRYSFVFKHAQSTFRSEFVKKWLDLILSIAKATTLPPRSFQDLLGKLTDLRQMIVPSEQRPPSSTQVQRVLTDFGKFMKRYWEVDVRGSHWECELAAYGDGISLEMDEFGWANQP